MELSSFQMVSLYYDPNGEKLFSHSTPGVSKSKESNSQILSKADLVANQTPYNVEELKAMIKELEAQLGEKNSAVSNIFFSSSLCGVCVVVNKGSFEKLYRSKFNVACMYSYITSFH